MPVDFVASSDGTKLPTRTRTDGAPASGTVEVPEGVTDFLDGSGNPVPVSATAPMPITTGTGITLPVSAASLPLPAGASTESTLSALNAKVTAVNTGAVVLAAGTAVAGRFGIDQTTPGTTNLVQVGGSLPAGTNAIGTVTSRIADTSGNGITSGSLTGGVRAVDVIVRDSTGAQVSSFGGNAVNLTQVNGTAMLTGGVNGSQGVGGLAASGAAVAGNPVLMGGSDGANARAMRMDALGNLVVTGKSLIVGPTALSATGTLIAATGAGDLSHVTIQLTGTFVATVTFEQSVDNTNWVNTFLVRCDTASQGYSATSTTTGIFAGQLQGGYFRARVSAYTSGTVTGTADFGSAPTGAVTQQVQLVGGGSDISRGGVSDASGGATNALYVYSFGGTFNGTNYDRLRNNHETTVYTSAARTTAQTGTDQTNFNARGVRLTIDITAITGAPSLTFTVQGKSTLSGKYSNILVSTALASVGTTVLQIYPGMLAAANLKADELLPRLWRVNVAVGTADSVTYSVDANYIL